MNNTTMTHEDYLEVYSDLYKEANGFRPRHNPEYNLDEWSKEFEYLHKIIAGNFEYQKASEELAKEAFKALIQKLINQGTKDYNTALIWLHDAHGTGGDCEYLCYDLGLPYNYFR